MKNLAILLFLSALLVGAQENGDSRTITPLPLRVVKKSRVGNEMAPITLRPYFCDSNDNLYYRKYVVTDTYQIPIQKVDSKEGKVTDTFILPLSPSGERFNARDIYVDKQGIVTALGLLKGKNSVWVIRFSRAGEAGNPTKLERDFIAQGPIAVFPTGELLVSGFEPTAGPLGKIFNAVFSPDGKLLRQIELSSDGKIESRGKQGDPEVAPPQARQLNLAVSDGRILIGSDGNAYLMRQTTPPEIFVISSTGDVLRTFVVKTDSGLTVSNMTEHGGKLAVFFKQRQMKGPSRIEVVDSITGEPIASYDGDQSLGSGFACYNGEYFTFIAAEEKMLTVLHVAP